MRRVRKRLRSRGGGGGTPVPSFFAPLSDSGAGAVSLALTNGTGSATFTRATTAWTKLSTGLWASVASGTARSCYLGADTTVGAYGGFLNESQRTNLCLQARDMSNASWTKVTMTAALDQTGIDGSANSASSLTATAGAATCLQTITEAATNSALSFFIKRITGTGTVTIQQGASTLDVTALINSSTYTQVVLVASVLNPAIGIKLTTNGDKIAVDMAQFENGAFATSPIPTTTVSVTRNADLLTYATASNMSATAGTCYAEATSGIASSANGEIISGFALGTVAPMGVNTNNVYFYDGTARNFNSLATPFLTVQKIATKWNDSANSANASLNGVLSTATAKTAAGLGASFAIGSNTAANSASINGTIKNVKVWLTTLSDSQMAGL